MNTKLKKSKAWYLSIVITVLHNLAIVPLVLITTVILVVLAIMISITNDNFIISLIETLYEMRYGFATTLIIIPVIMQDILFTITMVLTKQKSNKTNIMVLVTNISAFIMPIITLILADIVDIRMIGIVIIALIVIASMIMTFTIIEFVIDIIRKGIKHNGNK